MGPSDINEELCEQVSERARLLLSCLQHGPLEGLEAMKCVGLNHSTRFLYDYLQPKDKALLATKQEGSVE